MFKNNDFLFKKGLFGIGISSVIISVLNVVFSFSLGNITRSAINKAIQELSFWGSVSIFVLILLFIFESYNNKQRKIYCKNAILKLKENIYGKFDRISSQNVVNIDSEEIKTLLKDDVLTIYEDYYASIAYIISQLIKLIGSLTALMILDLSLFVMFIILSLIPLLLRNIYEKEVSIKKENFSKKSVSHLKKITEYITGLNVFKGFGVFKNINNEMLKTDKEYEELRSDLGETTGKMVIFSNTIGMITQVCCMILAAVYIILFGFEISLITTSTQLLNYIFAPFISINSNISVIKSCNPILNKARVFLEMNEKEESKTFSLENNRLEFKSVSFSYSDKNIIRNLSFKIESGNKAIIIGESGSGKTTLIKLLMRLLVPERGNILLGDVSINKFTEEFIFDEICYIPQKPFILEADLKKNIIFYGLESKEKYREVVEICRLENLEEKNTILTENNISGGEAQRIAIARGLISNKRIIVLDEPTSSLDPSSKQEVFEILLSLEGITVILVSHDYDSKILEKFDKVIKLD